MFSNFESPNNLKKRNQNKKQGIIFKENLKTSQQKEIIFCTISIPQAISLLCAKKSFLNEKPLFFIEAINIIDNNTKGKFFL